MHVIAQLLVTRFATPVILMGTIGLAAGGAVTLNSDSYHHGHGHHRCGLAYAQTLSGTAVAHPCWARHDNDWGGR
jgi:hypothetical protein